MLWMVQERGVAFWRSKVVLYGSQIVGIDFAQTGSAGRGHCRNGRCGPSVSSVCMVAYHGRRCGLGGDFEAGVLL